MRHPSSLPPHISGWQLPPGWKWGTEGLNGDRRHYQEIIDGLGRSLSLVTAPNPAHAAWLHAEAKGLAHRIVLGDVPQNEFDETHGRKRDVRVANAQIGVAIGDFFPRIGLTAFYGGTSTDLDNILKNQANIWSAAASAAGPVFTGGRLTGRYRQSKAAWEEAKLHYEQAALAAFREVSDALISRLRFEDERVEQSQAVGAGRDAVSVATDRYKEGKASYYEVLEAQQQLFPPPA